MKEWFQKCKDCRKEFGYSDHALQNDLKRGMNRPERCPDCRNQHSAEIKSIANSHFRLIPRKGKQSILGMPFLGTIDHGKRELKERPYQPNPSGMDFGLKDQHIRTVYDALKENQVLVIVAPTGTGKSTLIPFRLIYPLEGYEIDYFTKNGPIIITQPRIPATSGTAWAITRKILGSSVGAGFEVGYRHGDKSRRRKGEKYDRYNRLIPVTDGSLLNWITEGKIGKYSIVIIDEAHERSKNIDLILALIKSELLKYPHLKLIISSATIDADSFVNYYGEITKTKLLDFSDCQKTYGYDEDTWSWNDLTKEEIAFEQNEQIKKEAEKYLKSYEKNISQKVANKVLDILRKTKEGGILGFLHGKREIEDCIEQINNSIKDRSDLRVFPLYAELGQREIDMACAEFTKSDMVNIEAKRILPRRIVIATNIAETSITFKDIVWVVDSGLIKQTEWNPETERQELRTRFHSKDGCKQRWGRAGRVQKGYVYKVYSKEDFVKYFPQHTSPEITRECADDIILKSHASGVDPAKLSLMASPSEQEFKRASGVFYERNLTDKDNDLTEEGREVYRLAKSIGHFPNSTNRTIDVASLLIKADKYACLIEAVTVLVMMPHMGTSLYVDEEKTKDSANTYEGLLLWNRKWDIQSKDYIGRLQRELQIGCVDDLDFACKLFAMYEGKVNGIPDNLLKDWKTRYYINTDNFNLINEARKEILDFFTQGKKTDFLRPLDFSLVERVRLLMAISWSDRIVDIKHEKQFIFENHKTKIKGVLSENSAGNWSEKSKAIIGMMDQSDTVIDGNKKGAPVISFIIKTPDKIISSNASDTEIISEIIRIRKEFNLSKKVYSLFAHLFAPVGSKINTASNSTQFKSSDVVLPSLFRPSIEETIYYKDEEFDSSELYDHDTKRIRINKSHEEHKYGKFEKEKIVINNFEYKISDQKGKESAIVEYWEYSNGKPIAILSNVYEEQLLFKKISIPRGKDNLLIKLKRPVFDMQPNKIVGFIGEDENGNLIPISSLNLSIEQHNPGIKRLEKLEFPFKHFKTHNLPNAFCLTLLHDLEVDLKELINRSVVNAVVEKTSTDKIYFSIKGKDGFIHSTDVAIDFGIVYKILENLPLGEDVRLEIKSRFSKDEVLSVEIERNKTITNEDIQLLKSMNISVENNRLITNKSLQCSGLLNLQSQLPHLITEIRGLYSVSNHLTICDIEIAKFYKRLKNEVFKIKKEAVTYDNAAKENMDQFRDDLDKYKQMLLKNSYDELLQLANEAFQLLSDLSYYRKKLQSQKAYLIKVEEQIDTAKTYNFKIQRKNKEQEVLSEIADLEIKIKNLERLL